MPELKPCPFCGNKADLDLDYVDCTATVVCNNCGAHGSLCDTEEEAVAAWNKWVKDDKRETNNFMKIKALGFIILTMFFGIYAMILELRGIRNFDQIFYVFLFGVLAFFAE